MSEEKLPSPHLLLAIPRALVESTVWKKLPKGAQMFYCHLLTFSNTKTFKPVWPSQNLLRARASMTAWVQREYTAILQEAKLLITHKPGSWINPETGEYNVSKVYEFSIAEYINQDIASANKRDVDKGLPPRYREKKDVHRLEQSVIKLLKKQRITQKELRSIKSKIDLATEYLNFAARLIKIVGRDNEKITIEIYTDSAPMASYVSENLPKNVLLFPRKYNKNIAVNQFKSWDQFLGKISEFLEEAHYRAEEDLLTRLISKMSKLPTDTVSKIKAG